MHVYRLSCWQTNCNGNMNKEWIHKCIPAPVLIHKPSVKHGSHAVCVSWCQIPCISLAYRLNTETHLHPINPIFSFYVPYFLRLCPIILCQCSGIHSGHCGDPKVELGIIVATQQHVISSVQRQPPISWYHQLVMLQVEIVHLPLQVHKHGTDYCQPSAQPPNRSLPSKKNLNRFFLSSHFVCDNMYMTVLSTLAIVRTVWYRWISYLN